MSVIIAQDAYIDFDDYHGEYLLEIVWEGAVYPFSHYEKIAEYTLSLSLKQFEDIARNKSILK